MPLRPLIVLFLLGPCVTTTNRVARDNARAAVDGPETLLRLAFGSCSQTKRAQPLWSDMSARAPDVFLWLGDIIYADAPIFAKWRMPAEISDVSSEYEIQKKKPEYSAFLARGGAHGRAPIVIGIWDDHDLGVNDADVLVPANFRSASQNLLLNFLDVPVDAPQRARAGVYSAWDIEVERSGEQRGVRSVPEGGARAPNADLALRARIILLDVRSARQPWGSVSHDLLGAAQWEWLKRQLQESVASDASVTIIGSGIQTVAPGDPPTTEGWGRAPGALARLVALIGATRVRGVVLISGDVHFGELNVAEGASLILGYPLWEFTSSGLTHSWGGIIKGTAVAALLSGATRAALPGGPPWSPFNEEAAPEPRSRCSSDVPWRSLAWAAARLLGLADDEVEGGFCLYAGLNFGEIDISSTELHMRLWAEDRSARLIHTLPLAHLAAQPEASEARGAIMAEAELWPCAHADLSNGMPPACVAVLSALLPRVSWGAFLRRLAAHAAAALVAAAAVAAVVYSPIIVIGFFRKAPALFPFVSPLLAQAVVVANMALFIQFVVSPSYDFLHDALMS